MAYNVFTGFADYKESAKLQPHHRYQQAWGRHHASLIKPSGGTYTIRGSRIIFRHGGFARTPGKIVKQGTAAPFFDLLRHGKPSGWVCYWVRHP